MKYGSLTYRASMKSRFEPIRKILGSAFRVVMMPILDAFRKSPRYFRNVR